MRVDVVCSVLVTEGKCGSTARTLRIIARDKETPGSTFTPERAVSEISMADFLEIASIN